MTTAPELEERLLSETAPDRRLRSFAALLAADRTGLA